jgi:hypothetical protein
MSDPDRKVMFRSDKDIEQILACSQPTHCILQVPLAHCKLRFKNISTIKPSCDRQTCKWPEVLNVMCVHISVHICLPTQAICGKHIKTVISDVFCAMSQPQDLHANVHEMADKHLAKI